MAENLSKLINPAEKVRMQKICDLYDKTRKRMNERTNNNSSSLPAAAVVANGYDDNDRKIFQTDYYLEGLDDDDDNDKPSKRNVGRSKRTTTTKPFGSYYDYENIATYHQNSTTFTIIDLKTLLDKIDVSTIDQSSY